MNPRHTPTGRWPSAYQIGPTKMRKVYDGIPDETKQSLAMADFRSIEGRIVAWHNSMKPKSRGYRRHVRRAKSEARR